MRCVSPSQMGVDLDLSLHKRITLDDFNDHFDKGTKWYRASDRKVVEKVGQAGRSPGGVSNVPKKQPWEMYDARPIHFATDSPRELEHKPYPRCSYDLAFDPMAILHHDLLARDHAKSIGVDPHEHWAHCYLIPLGGHSHVDPMCSGETGVRQGRAPESASPLQD